MLISVSLSSYNGEESTGGLVLEHRRVLNSAEHSGIGGLVLVPEMCRFLDVVVHKSATKPILPLYRIPLMFKALK